MASIGLALGGGAVRGAAHIGVLAALEDAGLAPAVVTGTSAGAVVGAGSVLGRDVRLYPNAVVYPFTELGDRVVLHAGAQVGR